MESTNKTITQKQLKELLHYDNRTGIFTRKKLTNRTAIAGGVSNKDGYNRISIKNKRFLAHRLAWLYEHGKFPKHTIDHINHNRSDNRISNLREVAHKVNCMNQSKRSNNKSGITGVYFDKERNTWNATICIDGKTKALGRYSSISEAAQVRSISERENGFHTNHGKAV